MNGLGNEFVIFDYLGNDEFYNYFVKNNLGREDIYNFSVRAYDLAEYEYDQLIIIHSSLDEGADCVMYIYNQDGTAAAACGNAARCVARLFYEFSAKDDNIKIEVLDVQGKQDRILIAHKIAEKYQVNMGKAEEVNLADDSKYLEEGYRVDIGNPHIIFFVDDLEQIDLEKEFSHIEQDSEFSSTGGINVNVVQVLDKGNIKIRTWERGAGATLACGTGACASSFVAFKEEFAGNKIKVNMPLGSLDIEISDDDEVLMVGDANYSK